MMAKRSTLATLPEDIRHAFERKLAENGFANYTELTQWLHEQGYEVSRSPCTVTDSRWSGVMPASKPAPKPRD